MSRYVPLSLPLLLLPACADGGKQDIPPSEVKIAASHHLFGFRSLRGFGTFPVQTSVALSDRGKLNLFDDSTYTVTRTTGTTGADRYALATDGSMSIYVTGSGRDASVVFRGAYGQVTGSHPDFFFTDRVSDTSSPSVGLYFGTRVISGQVELGGAWHVLSLHTVFDGSVPGPDNVGRGAHGAVTVADGDPGTARAISGTGFQGTSALVFGGSIQNLLTSDVGDGSCNLTMSYQLPGLSADSRVMRSAATNDVVFGLDEDESDGEAGLLLMLRKFDAPASPVDPVRVAGTFLVGGHTLFVNPTNMGSDAFVGVVTLSSQGGFDLDAVGASGESFSYVGTYSLAADGGMTITVAGTNETWFAAIDRTYDTFAFVDDFVEVRSNNIPELNLAFGVRQKS